MTTTRRIATLNVAMIPLGLNSSDFTQAAEERASAIASFIEDKKLDIICCQELFGLSAKKTFIAEMLEKGYKAVDQDSDRSGIVTFYKSELNLEKAVFSPHSSADYFFSVESVGKKGILISEFKDKKTNEVFTVANTHLTGGFTDRFIFGINKKKRLQKEGGTSEMRNRQFKHMHKVLKHLYVPTSEYIVFAGDINQDMTFKPNGKQPYQWDLQIGFSMGKHKKSGLRNFLPGMVKYSGPQKFFSEFKPVIPFNFDPKKVIPSIKGRLDPLNPYESSPKRGEPGTDTGSRGLKALKKLGPKASPEEKLKQKHEHNVGKLIDVLTYTETVEAKTKSSVSTHIIDTGEMTDHQSIFMEINRERFESKNITNPHYAAIVQLKWKYLQGLERKPDESKADYCLDALNLLLDRIKVNDNLDFIDAEITKTIYVISQDDHLNILVDDLKKNQTTKMISAESPERPKEPSFILITDSIVSIQDSLLSYLSAILHSYEQRYIFNDLSLDISPRLDPHECHKNIMIIEKLKEQLQTPHLVEGEFHIPLAEQTKPAIIKLARKFIDKAIKQLLEKDVLHITLTNLNKQLLNAQYFLGYDLQVSKISPKESAPNTIHLYLDETEQKKIKYTYVSPQGAIKKGELDEVRVRGKIVSGENLDLTEQCKIFEMIHQQELSVEEKKDQFTKSIQADILDELRKIIADIEIKEGHRATVSSFFKQDSSAQEETSRLLLANLLNYLEYKADDKTSLVEYDKLAKREVFTVLNIMNKCNFVNASIITSLALFQKNKNLNDLKNMRDEKAPASIEIKEGTAISSLHNQFIDHLRYIKTNYHLSKKPSLIESRMLERLLQHFLQHSLETLEHNRIRKWTTEEFLEYAKDMISCSMKILKEGTSIYNELEKLRLNCVECLPKKSLIMSK